MRLFIISETLTTGGAEWFVLRLAKALCQEGHDVTLFVLRSDIINKKLLQEFNELKIKTLPASYIKILANADRIINKITGRNILVENANVKFINKYIKKEPPKAIHGHLIEADLVAVKLAENTTIQTVATIHGDYIGALKKNTRLKEINYLMKQLKELVVISEEQKKILLQSYPFIHTKLTKIYNGYPLNKQHHNIKDEAKDFFCFGMIARAIPEKGWEPLIKAFLKLDNDHLRLALYGEGAYLDELKIKYPDKRIVFYGFTNKPLKAIASFDVGLLPSYFTAESLPTTIIEYLALEKPVIATDVGEVKNMIVDKEGASAGIIIEALDKDKMVQPLYEAMKKMVEDKQFYEAKKQACKTAFEKFEMDKCIAAYTKLYAKN